MFRVLLFVGFIWWFTSWLKKRRAFNVKVLISMMFFAGVGFALGDYVGDGWGIFGLFFGLLVGIELKEKFYDTVKILYKDLMEK